MTLLQIKRRFLGELTESRELLSSRGVRSLSRQQFNQVVSLAFLKAYTSWEAFAEDVFFGYLLGNQSPAGYKPKRYYKPPTRDLAFRLLLAENRFLDWASVDKILNRSSSCFKDGEPFSSKLGPRDSYFHEMKKIRNCIAHSSAEAKLGFDDVVRRKLGSVPLGIVPGTFLDMQVLNMNPPRTYFEDYLQSMESCCGDLVP